MVRDSAEKSCLWINRKVQKKTCSNASVVVIQHQPGLLKEVVRWMLRSRQMICTIMLSMCYASRYDTFTFEKEACMSGCTDDDETLAGAQQMLLSRVAAYRES